MGFFLLLQSIFIIKELLRRDLEHFLRTISDFLPSVKVTIPISTATETNGIRRKNSLVSQNVFMLEPSTRQPVGLDWVRNT